MFRGVPFPSVVGRTELSPTLTLFARNYWIAVYRGRNVSLLAGVPSSKVGASSSGRLDGFMLDESRRRVQTAATRLFWIATEQYRESRRAISVS
jgi:hypothetical protein